MVKELIVSEIDSQTRQEAVAALMPSVVDLIKDAGWNKSELDCIVVGEGPGSFTGVRTCVVTGRTMAQGLRLPLLAVSLLDCYAGVCEMPAAVILSAGRGRYFVAGYPGGAGVSPVSKPGEAGVSPVSKPGDACVSPASEPGDAGVSPASEPGDAGVSPASVSLDELADLFSDFPIWYLDQKAFSELQEHADKLTSPPDARSPILKYLPILENIATKQAQIAWNRLSLNLSLTAPSEDSGKRSDSSENNLPGKDRLLRDSLLQIFPYDSVKPLYLRSPSITLKKTASEKPHGS